MKQKNLLSRRLIKVLSCMTLIFGCALTIHAEGNDGPKIISVGTDETYQSIQMAIDYISEQEDKTNWTIKVSEGTYDRFVVRSGLDGLSIVGQGESTVIKTLVEESKIASENGVVQDYGGIIINKAGNVSLKNLKMTMGHYTDYKVNKDGSVESLWCAAAIALANGATSMEADNGFSIENCTITGSGVGYGFMADNKVDTFTIRNSVFQSCEQAIYFENTASHPKNVIITDNSFNNCSFAIHGSYSNTDRNKEVGSLTFSHNKINGTDSLRNKFIFQDTDNENVVSLDVTGNTLTNAIVGLVNLREEGEIISDVLKTNNFNGNSHYVEAMEPGTIEFYSTYHVPEGSVGQWKLTEIDDLDIDWGKNPDGSTAYVQNLINQANANHSTTLTITGIDENNLIKTFTWFKDAIYWETTIVEEEEDPTPEVTPDPKDEEDPIPEVTPDPKDEKDPTLEVTPASKEDPTPKDNKAIETGDTTDLALYTAMLGLSVIGLAVSLVLKKKIKKEL